MPVPAQPAELPPSAGITSADAEARALLDIVSALAREAGGGRALPPIGLDASLERDCALDSLARVELGLRLQHAFGVGLHEAVLFEAETPRDLLAGLRTAPGARKPACAPAPLTPAAAPTAAGEIALPLAAHNLVDMLAWHATRHGERSHIRLYSDDGDGAALSYRGLWDGASAVAAGLQARDLLPGERVALMLPTGLDYFLAFYGVVLAGGVPVPIYPPARRTQLEDHLRRQARILANCRAAFLIAPDDAHTLARLLGASVASLRGVLGVAALAADGAPCEPAAPRADELAFVQYTSGSTGDPKGVMLTHANLLANIRADGQGLAATPDDVFVSWLPLYHDMGLIGAWLGSLYHAVPLVVMSPLAFLARPERWLWALHRHGGTLSAAPNFAYELCVSRIRDTALAGLDLSRWRAALNGAEAVSPRTLEAFCARYAAYGFRREAMLPVYGLAECAVGLAFSPLGRGPRVDRIARAALATLGDAVPAPADATGAAVREVVACGLPLPGHELRIVDARDRELPERHEGKVQFRGPSATSGYFEQPAATAALVRDGWLETGDRGYLAGGELYLTGRDKDLIIRAGRNLHPTELEDAIGALDGIRKGHVAVFGSHAADSGTERLIVLAETRKRGAEARAALEADIVSLATDLLGTPPDVIVLAEPNTVLRTSSGKIRRAACRALYERGELARGAPAPWLQLARLAAAGVVPQVRRALAALAAWAHAGRAWVMLGTLGAVAWLLTWLPLSARALWVLEHALARALLSATGTRLATDGLAALAAPERPLIVVANHQSYLDGIVLFAALPRPVRFLVKAELARSPLLGRPLARLGALYVERFDAAGGVASLREAGAALARGETLVVFPEGTFKRMPGLLPFHLGAFALAVERAVPLVPLALRGTRSLLRAGSWFPRRGAVQVLAGPTLTAPAAGSAWERALTLRDATRSCLVEGAGEPDLAHESNRVEPGT